MRGKAGLLIGRQFKSALVISLIAVTRVAAAAQDFAPVDAYVDAQRITQRIPGLALAVVGADGTIHVGGFGVTDPGGAAITSQTPFILGSTSKSFTALAVMQLVEAGSVELDAPVQRYLPWFAVADAQASAQITVRQLLNQTSGLSTASGRRTLTEYSSGDDALENRVRGLRDVALTAPVGTMYQYSNCNYQVLGAIVQAVSGTSFEGYLQTHVFDPLGMTHTYTSKSAAVANGLAIGHRTVFGRPVAFDEPLPRGRRASSSRTRKTWPTTSAPN
jgi:CubicO group peptidase (beta-lactamase class C family)